MEAPASDAWDSYDKILAEVKRVGAKYEKGKTLIMTALGPTAKVMVYDLTKEGYTAWDTGQFFDLALKKI